jgi:hypothetical protein
MTARVLTWRAAPRRKITWIGPDQKSVAAHQPQSTKSLAAIVGPQGPAGAELTTNLLLSFEGALI